MTAPTTVHDARARAASAYPRPALYIDGTWRSGSGEATVAVLDPATEQEIARVEVATAADVDAAIAAAHAAFPGWRALAPADRAAILLRAVDLLAGRREELAAVIAYELGKPLPQARVEVDTAVGHIRWNAEEGRRTYGRVIPAAAGRQQLVLREPIGPVAAFAPWNAPLITPARKITSALAAGCTVVIKPAEETPGAAVLLVQALADAGLPPGVVNVVFGDPPATSRQLLEDPRIRAMTFTGSVPVGRSLATLAGAHLKPAVMELGGHAPVIVCADAATDRLAASTAQAAYRNAGQVCTSPTRLYVERAAYDRFVARLGEEVRALRVGDPFEAGVHIGPLATAKRRQELEELIADATDHGARIVSGGRRAGSRGYFFEPTLLVDVPDDARIASTEPFGPIATVAPFDTLDEAIGRANEVPVGLAGYVFTDSVSARATLLAGLDCGSIAVNNWQVSGSETPFGGRRDSGFGSEGGVEGVAAFQHTKFVSLDERQL